MIRLSDHWVYVIAVLLLIAAFVEQSIKYSRFVRAMRSEGKWLPWSEVAIRLDRGDGLLVVWYGPQFYTHWWSESPHEADFDETDENFDWSSVQVPELLTTPPLHYWFLPRSFLSRRFPGRVEYRDAVWFS